MRRCPHWGYPPKPETSTTMTHHGRSIRVCQSTCHPCVSAAPRPGRWIRVGSCRTGRGRWHHWALGSPLPLIHLRTGSYRYIGLCVCSVCMCVCRKVQIKSLLSF